MRSLDSLRGINKTSFSNIDSVIHSNKIGSWLNIQDSNFSCTLFFNTSAFGPDTVMVKYSPECYFYFPLTTSSGTIVLYWDKIIDTKYDFKIIKLINKIDKKYLGKPFMTLKLINDTMMKATYLFPEIAKTLNSADTNRLIFPTLYTFNTDISL